MIKVENVSMKFNLGIEKDSSFKSCAVLGEIVMQGDAKKICDPYCDILMKRCSIFFKNTQKLWFT